MNQFVTNLKKLLPKVLVYMGKIGKILLTFWL